MVVCLVKGCRSSCYKNTSKITFHHIPKASYNHWARICNISGSPLKNKHKKVCSLHFEDACFDRTGQTTRLRNYAVPTLLLPSDCVTSCLICLQMVEDPFSMASLTKVLSVEDNMNFSIFDLIYSISNVKLEIEQNISNICPNCVNGAVQAFKFKQMCVNAGQHQFKHVNAHKYDVNVKTIPTIKMEQIKDESIDISETFITSGTNDEDDSDMFEEEMESQEIEIKVEPNMEHTSEEAEGTKQTLPLKSQPRYEQVYDAFEKWRIERQFNSYSERVLLTYIKELSKKFKPTSLYKLVSILKATIKAKNYLDISMYGGIQSFMKQYANGYKPKKSKILTSEHINTFIDKADDHTYLFTKVGVIMGICGGCSKCELLNLKISEIEDCGTHFLVTLHDSSARKIRTFVIPPSFYNPVRKYFDLRPTDLDNQRFFIHYLRGRCTRQVAGINKLAAVPKKVAEFLKLPNPELYGEHALRSWANTYNFNMMLEPGKWKSLDDIQVPKGGHLSEK